MYLFNVLFCRTTWVSQYQKDKTVWWDFGMQCHQLDHMQTISTSLQTDNHINTSSLNFFTSGMLFLTSNPTNSVKALKAPNADNIKFICNCH